MSKKVYVDEDGVTVTEYRNSIGEIHRLDGPAVEGSDGHKSWWLNDQIHRLDGPAIEGSDGYKGWFINGMRHRLDGPAIEYANGCKGWYLYDKQHRLDGPAIEYEDGSKCWYVYDKHACNSKIYCEQFQKINNLLKLTILQNKSRKFNEWLFDPNHYAGRWHKKNMLRDFQAS